MSAVPDDFLHDRDRLNEDLLKLWAKTQKTIAFVTHSIPEAVYLSTHIVVMSPRPGRITDVIHSPLPADRPLDIRDTPEFIDIAHRVREGLRAGHVPTAAARSDFRSRPLKSTTASSGCCSTSQRLRFLSTFISQYHVSPSPPLKTLLS